MSNMQANKVVIDGLAANAFRVVGVGQDVVLESFYLYPNLSKLANSDPAERQTLEFNMDPEHDADPNIRIIMSREVAARLASALAETLGLQREPQPVG